MMEKKVVELHNAHQQGLLDRRQFITRMGAIAGGTAVAASVLPLLASKPAMAQFETTALTMKERDRRWKVIRTMMKEEDLDCLIIPNGSGDRYIRYAEYVSNTGFMNPGAVILPLDEDLAIFGTLPRPGAWITDVGAKGVPLGEAIVAKINKLGYAKKHFGVIGTEGNVVGFNEFTDQGTMLYSVWSHVLQNLPKATFVDVTPQFTQVMLVRSPEEIRLYEQTALVGEGLHELLLDFVKPGITDVDFRVQVSEYFIRKGARADVQSLEMKPGIAVNGDVINTEYGINYRGGYAQVTLCTAIGKVSAQTERLRETAEECMRVGLEKLKPGVKFSEVVDPMEKVIADAGFWTGYPVIHSLGGLVLVAAVANGPPPFKPSATLGPDVVIKENMIFSYEPNARSGRTAQVKVGGTGLVTDQGVRMFNQIGQTMQRI